MNQTCSSILRMDWHIKFVCILDQNGKLLVGQDRNIPSSNTNDNDKNPISSTNNIFDIANSKLIDFVELYFKHKNMYLFYSNYLLWNINYCRLHINDSQNNDNSRSQSIVENKTAPYFELSGYYNDDVMLAVTPINGSKSRFLCIYFEPAYSIRNSFNITKEIFENLLNNVINILQELR
ncbi:MAG TPA: hypothetical protein VH796_01630 [Nitrososphaeraceae archaeon]